MPTYEHEQILRALNQLSQPPGTGEAYERWIEARGYLDLIEQNAVEDEVILLLSASVVVPKTQVYSAYVNCVLVDEDDVSPPDHDDLLRWGFQPMANRAGTGIPTMGMVLRRCTSPTMRDLPRPSTPNAWSLEGNNTA